MEFKVLHVKNTPTLPPFPVLGKGNGVRDLCDFIVQKSPNQSGVV